MGFGWEQVLGATSVGLANACDEQAANALYQDHPTPVPPGAPVEVGDEKVDLPFDEV